MQKSVEIGNRRYSYYPTLFEEFVKELARKCRVKLGKPVPTAIWSMHPIVRELEMPYTPTPSGDSYPLCLHRDGESKKDNPNIELGCSFSYYRTPGEGIEARLQEAKMDKPLSEEAIAALFADTATRSEYLKIAQSAGNTKRRLVITHRPTHLELSELNDKAGDALLAIQNKIPEYNPMKSNMRIEAEWHRMLLKKEERISGADMRYLFNFVRQYLQN